MSLIDSHCHLNYPGLVEDEAGVLGRARSRGVTGFLNISTRQSEWAAVLGAAERHADVWAAIGVHPHEADAHPDLGAAMLIDAARHPRVVALGECGLDYHYDKSDRSAQRERFRAHIAAARATGLPIVIHTRDAEQDTVTILEEELAAHGNPIRGVLHCFTGSAWLAGEGLRLGLSISLSGIVTFKNAKDLQAVALTIPRNRLLVETDAPFLAPVPHRGKSCEPAFVADTAAFLADLRQEPLADLQAWTTENFFRLFDRAGAQAA